MTGDTRGSDPAAGEPGSGLVRAGTADLETLSQVIADAFFDLPPSRWLIPDPAARRDIFPGYFRLCVQDALAAGVVHTTPGRDAAALWLPAGQVPAGPAGGYAARLAAATGPWTGRFLSFDAALGHHHPAGIPHWHLAILAVAPGRQGQGTGTALLRGYHRHLDRRLRAPAYLEASGQASRRLYLRHGYADHGPPIRLPGGPVLYPMWREPRLARIRTPGDALSGLLPGELTALLNGLSQ